MILLLVQVYVYLHAVHAVTLLGNTASMNVFCVSVHGQARTSSLATSFFEYIGGGGGNPKEALNISSRIFFLVVVLPSFALPCCLQSRTCTGTVPPHTSKLPSSPSPECRGVRFYSYVIYLPGDTGYIFFFSFVPWNMSMT